MKKHVIGFLIGVGLFVSVGTTFAAQDIMEVMFAPTKAHEKVVDLGATKQAVGDEVFRSSYQVIGGTTQAPLLVRITKFLLRMTIVLSITMVLYNGVLWIIESSKGAEIKDAKNNLIYIFGGILLSLLSVTLINLVSSLGISSLDPEKVANPEEQDCGVLQTMEDQWINNKCGQITVLKECIEAKPHHDLYNTYNCASNLSTIQLQSKRDIWENKKCNLVTLDIECANLIPYRNQYVDKILCPSLAIKVQQRKDQKCSIFKKGCEDLNKANDNFVNYGCK